MNKTLVISREKGLDSASLIEDGRLTEFLSRDSSSSPQVGNIYLGRIANIVPALNSAFVEIGDKRTAMLPFTEIPDSVLNGQRLHAGMEFAVQVTKLPGGDKGVLVSANLKLPGKHCVLLPYTDNAGVSKKITDEAERIRLRELALKLKPLSTGIILRTSAAESDEEELGRDIHDAFEYWNSLSARIAHIKAPKLLHDESDVVLRAVRDFLDDETDQVFVTGEGMLDTVTDTAARLCPGYLTKIVNYDFDISPFTLYRITSQFETAKARKVFLESGGFLIFDKTEALTVIDVNSGKDTRSASIADTAYMTNMEAAEEIVRQIRLRDIGGIVIIDFIDMDTKQRKEELVQHLRACFKTDRAKVNVVGMTGLGLVELTRKKRNDGSKVFPSTEQTHD